MENYEKIKDLSVFLEPIVKESEALTRLNTNEAGLRKTNNFSDILSEIENKKAQIDKSFDQASCNDKTFPLDCYDMKRASENNSQLQDVITASIQNIANVNQPNYKRTFGYKDENGNFIKDERPGKLLRSHSKLHFALNGEGKGFKLENGEYTRDGRFIFDREGHLVTQNKGIRPEITYEKDAPTDWSRLSLKIDKKGNIFDKTNGKKLGKFEANLGEDSKIYQGYVEASNVNLPMEMLSLSNNMRLLEVERAAMTTSKTLDRETIQLARSVI